MILELLPQIRQLRIVLASQSPRRRELLERVYGITPEIVPSTFAEDLPHSAFSTPQEYCLATAKAKAQEVFARLTSNEIDTSDPIDMVIASDSIVVTAAGTILEKARDEEHAAGMLRSVSGSASHVTTALVLITRNAAVDGEPIVTTLVETTKVRFAELSDAEIQAYVASADSWRGKAGAYGIQDVAAAFITGIDGDYYTVMGLPVHRFGAAVRGLVDSGSLALP